MLSEFVDVFEKPGSPPAAGVQYRIDLINEGKAASLPLLSYFPAQAG